MSTFDTLALKCFKYGGTISLLLPGLVLLFIDKVGIYSFPNNYTFMALWFVISIILLVTMIVFIAVRGGIGATKRGIHYIRHCDIKTFEQIDFYKKHYNNKEFDADRRTIEVINLFYKKNGRVDDEFVKTKDLKSLYTRYDFLEKEISLLDEIKSNIITIAMAVIYSIMGIGFERYGSDVTKESFGGGALLILGVFLFYWIVIIMRSYRGQFGSFMYRISKYEMELLEKKIYEVEKSLKISKKQEPIIRMQQVVILSLIDYKKNNKNFTKEIEKELEEISSFHLCENVPEGSKKKSFKDKEEFKYYYMKKYKGDKLEGDGDFDSEQYKFYEIIVKYKNVINNYIKKQYEKEQKGSIGYCDTDRHTG